MAADFPPSTPATIEHLVAVDNTVITDCTVRVTVTAPDGTTIVSDQPATFDGLSLFAYTIPAASLGLIGTYAVVWTVTGTATETVSTAFTVDHDVSSVDTLQSLRRQVSRLVEGEHDYTEGSVSTITGQGITDGDRVEPKGHWNGAEIYMRSGALAGQTFRVTAFDPAATPQFTTTPGMGGVGTGSGYEMRKRLRVRRIDHAIRDVIRGVQSSAFFPVTGEVTLSGSTVEYDIPPSFERIHGVEILLPSGAVLPVAPASWSSQVGRRTLRLAPSLAWRYSGCTARLLGLRPADLPLRDNSRIDVPGNYVRYATASLLAATMVTGAQGDPWALKTKLWGDLAAAESDFAHRIPNNTKRV